MRFGICGSPGASAAIKAAGWDYVEGNVQGLLQGELPDEQWKAGNAAKTSAIPILAANCLVPGNLKITGPQADLGKLRSYMSRVLERAPKIGARTLVFGSGGARQVPEGFDRETARRQILDFLRMSAELASPHDVVIVCEPLNRKECNIINSVAEAMTYVRAVDHPNFQCLVDSYHFWLEDEPLENLRQAMPWIKHVHLADKVGRVAPGLSGQSDYAPFFKVLKEGNYSGLISFEGKAMNDFPATAPKVLDYIKQAWARA